MNNPTNRVQRYTRAMTRGYYRLLDFGQRWWHRFRKSEVGCFVIWLTPRLLKATWWMVKVILVIDVIMLLLAFGMMAAVFVIMTGTTKEAIRSFTKIVIVLIGLVAVKKAVSSDKGAAVVKAISS